MRPLRLTLENVASYRGVHKFDFSGVNLAVLSGRNGSGKSTLAVKAPRYALFGTTDGDADSIINGEEDVCRVEFAFALGDQHYLISRQRSRKGGGKTALSFQSIDGDNPVVLDGASIAETQARIEETLCMNDSLFTMTACADQGHTARFSEAKPAERKAVLTQILGLDMWERRAEVARRLVRDLTAANAATSQRLGDAQEKAAEAEGLQEQITELGAQLKAAETKIGTNQAELDEAQEGKASIIRDREADNAQRERLKDLGEQVEAAEADVTTHESKLKRLGDSVEGAEKLADKIEQAGAAQAQAEALEGKREKDEDLRHEAELAKQRQVAAKAEHRREIEAAEAEATQAEVDRTRERAAAQKRVQDLRAQAEPLERVPCVGTKYEGQCPLIELARNAREQLPEAEAELAPLEPPLAPDTPPHPAAPHWRRHAELQAQEPGAEERARLLKITEEREALAYDAQEHNAAKDAAARLPELQQKQAEVKLAEAQIADAQEKLDAARAKVTELTASKASLEAELGEARDWDALLRDVGETMASARAAIAEVQSQLQGLQQQQGGLQERLGTAQAAAAEAEELATELRRAEKRLRLVKVLVQAFGKQGIPALLIEQAVPELEATANDTLAVLSDGRMSLALKSQSETKSGTLRETLDIVVNDERGPRPYETFSGGEQMRVDVAVRIGLSMLLANRAGARIEMCVLDEPAGALDTEGRMLFVECLSRLTDRFATILVISHIEALQDAFPQQLAVSRNSDGSQVELVAA